MTLSKKLMIYFIITITISILVTSFMSNSMINKRFDSYLIEEQNVKFERVRDEINDLLIEKGSSISAEDISSLASSEGIYISVLDTNNNLLCHSNNRDLLHRGMRVE